MLLNQPATWCTERGVHGPHIDTRVGGGPGECPGLDPEAAAVKALIYAVEDYAHKHWWPVGPPEGTVLELHPAVHNMIRRTYVPSYDAFVSGDDNPFGRINVPVKLNPELPRNAWRLCRITVEIYTGGMMPGE